MSPVSLNQWSRLIGPRAAEQINAILAAASAADSEEAAVQPLIEMHRHSALQMLLSAFVRCSAWPEVELPVSRAIAHLVAVEDEVDWQTLQQSARDILAALQILVSQSLSSELVRQQVRIAGEEDSPAAASEHMRLRELIAKAIFKLCFVLSKHWSQSANPLSAGSLAATPARPPSWDFSDAPVVASPNLSYRELRRSRGISRVVVDVGQLLGMIANIISLLTGDEGAVRHEQHVIDETTVLCASAMLSLSKVRQGRQSFVTHGSMGLVARWLEESRFILADAYNRMRPLPEVGDQLDGSLDSSNSAPNVGPPGVQAHLEHLRDPGGGGVDQQRRSGGRARLLDRVGRLAAHRHRHPRDHRQGDQQFD